MGHRNALFLFASRLIYCLAFICFVFLKALGGGRKKAKRSYEDVSQTKYF